MKQIPMKEGQRINNKESHMMTNRKTISNPQSHTNRAVQASQTSTDLTQEVIFMNTVTIIGNLGKDPDVNTLPSNTKVASFSVAVNEVYTKNGERQEKTHWIPCKCFGKTAELAENYLHKGSKVAIVGRLAVESWETTGGDKRSAIRVIADNIDFLSPRSGNGGTKEPTEVGAGELEGF
jgi:single-strand DNA-binding protein